jgi:hypothetical protein
MLVQDYESLSDKQRSERRTCECCGSNHTSSCISSKNMCTTVLIKYVVDQHYNNSNNVSTVSTIFSVEKHDFLPGLKNRF